MRSLQFSHKLNPFIRPMAYLLEKISALDKIEATYRAIPPVNNPQTFIDEALRILGISWSIEGSKENIPSEGPLLIVANHPFGGVEGLILGTLLFSIRPDVKIVGNYLLMNIKELRDVIIPVDPFGRIDSPIKNAGPLRTAIEWLKNGGALVVFPSGTVSNLSIKTMRISDPPWNDIVAKVALKTEATVLPVFFHGSNRPIFHLLGIFHPRLRTILLPRELDRKRGKHVKLTIGEPISFKDYSFLASPEALIEYFRLRTYALSLGSGERKKKILPITKLKKIKKVKEPAVAEPVDPEILKTEVASLPQDNFLVKSGAFAAVFAKASMIPNILREIGRLREISFRSAGEGTLKQLDIDEFDSYYDHLFLWHLERNEIIGAYRIGKGREIVSNYGVSGFYTSTLFKYSPRISKVLEEAIELGRSFIRPEYQRHHTALWLLWRGIGSYISRHQNIRFLFGPVSISNDYHCFSKLTIQTFLQRHLFDSELASMIVARNPWKKKALPPWNIGNLCDGLSDIEDLDRVVFYIENRKRGIPTLLKHYLKLGGKAAGFNVDHQFSKVLDVLVFVDLLKIPYRMLEKTMGKEEAQFFIANLRISN